ncbi:Myb13 protein [Carex littledalei]|uniref:Myb13 protein n=1 Tax=Carex littledalei TaxID=544730 RepID=A0A833V4F6_9POAL|nr:Myb13 protein [Carex littledalei]
MGIDPVTHRPIGQEVANPDVVSATNSSSTVTVESNLEPERQANSGPPESSTDARSQDQLVDWLLEDDELPEIDDSWQNFAINSDDFSNEWLLDYQGIGILDSQLDGCFLESFSEA